MENLAVSHAGVVVGMFLFVVVHLLTLVDNLFRLIALDELVLGLRVGFEPPSVSDFTPGLGVVRVVHLR